MAGSLDGATFLHTDEVRVDPFSVALTRDSWLSPAAARYALERLRKLTLGEGGRTNLLIKFTRTWSKVQADDLLRDASHVGWMDVGELLPDTIDGVPTTLLPAPYCCPDRPLIRLVEGRVGEVVIDLPSFTYYMLSRWEESQPAHLDERERFPAQASLAYRAGFLDRPVIDEWAALLRLWIHQNDPDARSEVAPFRIFLSHDIDAVIRFQTRLDVLKYTAAACLRRGARSAAEQFKLGVAAVAGRKDDPFVDGVRRLMAVSESRGLRSSFYFKAADRGPFDTGYRVDSPPAGDLIHEVVERGHEVGFHPGYETFCRPDLLRREKGRLDKVSPTRILGGRQHNLRFKVPDTWRHWADAGLVYDSTLGYAEVVGFRCGTAHPFPVFDCENDRPLHLIEVPLIVMDTTLFSRRYMGLTRDQARETVRVLAERVKRTGGVFALLWHNTSFSGSYEAWDGLYEELVSLLCDVAGGTPVYLDTSELTA